jgi:glycine/D-amino acid oxidase-like deaminating enzyme
MPSGAGPTVVQEIDVAVVGGGFAGLLVADRLSTLGYRVALIEQSPRLLAGTSSRNEGWLHAGTYHAVSIRDRGEAMTVARRCLTGWREFRARFPHAIEAEEHRTVAIVPAARAEDIESRWQEAGVTFESMDRPGLSRIDANVAMSGDERAYQVADVGIETRMVAASLVRKLRYRGVTIHTGARAERSGDLQLTVHTNGDRIDLRYRYIVVAAGYDTESAVRSLGLPPVQVRLWRSHLMTTPRAAETSVFSVAPGDAAMINHRSWSIIGLNEDAMVVDHPTFEPDREVAARLEDAVRRRFPKVEADRVEIRACVKVDYAEAGDDPRSLNVRVLPIEPHAAIVLPGKMTEAPVVADTTAHIVFAALGSTDITDRPHDLMIGDLAHA